MGNKQGDMKKSKPLVLSNSTIPPVNPVSDRYKDLGESLHNRNTTTLNSNQTSTTRMEYKPNIPVASGSSTSEKLYPVLEKPKPCTSNISSANIDLVKNDRDNQNLKQKLEQVKIKENQTGEASGKDTNDPFKRTRMFSNKNLQGSLENIATIQSNRTAEIPPLLGLNFATNKAPNNANKRGVHHNRGRGNVANQDHVNRGGHHRGKRGGPRGGFRGNRNDHRGGNRGRGNQINYGPGLLPIPNTFQNMDWFNMTPIAAGPPNQGFTANDLPIRNNYGGRYGNAPDDARSESNHSNRGRGRGARQHAHGKFMGFKKLEEILEMEPDKIVLGLCSEEAGFEKLLKSDLSNDYIVLIMRVISKCCETTFQENKGKMLARICEKDFMDRLVKYLSEINLHDRNDKFRNKYFWNNKDLFWTALINFYEHVIHLIPNTACEVLPKLIKQTILTITNLETNENVLISDTIKGSLEEIQVKMLLCVDEREKKKIQKPKLMQDEDPPDNFRAINLYPTVREITDNSEKVFLRANIIDGNYRSVDHYLDVHFRLMREDFIAPLRDGVCQYLSQLFTRERKRIFNIRFYEKVMFIAKYTMQDKVAVVIQLNMGKKKIKLENTRRFMFGSLVCFTNNHFQSVTFGTVASRDRNLLEKNQIAIDIIGDGIVYNANYTMVECSVFFEPYYHVLKALQIMTEDNFPLKRYIIDVEPDVFPPKYLNDLSRIEYESFKFYALRKERWPDAQQLGLDPSQYRAFQAALTKEFCVIQGPPGTGKTYIGLKITEVLLENHSLWRSSPILVICFTNHALDQFLEGICEFTEKVVRIGGQSKNEKLKEFNIREMRYKYHRTKEGNKLLYQRRDEIKRIMNEIQRLQKIVDETICHNRIINPRGFEVIDGRMQNSWFVRVKNQELLEWLLGGHSSEDRYQEHRKQRLMNQAAQVQAVTAENPNSGDSDEDEEEFFDPEEEQQREIDDVDQLFSVSMLAHMGSSALLTKQQIEDKINALERQLADIAVQTEETNSFVVFNERGMLEAELNKTYGDLEYFNWRMNQLKTGKPPPRPLIIDYNNPLGLSPNDRWGMYAHWITLYRNSLMLRLNTLHNNYRQVYRQYEEVKQIEDIQLMRDMHVVGMTTCGAARYQTLLQALKCPIVIVEEAAEVLESHVVVSLTNDCQQLILIGDHKQLRPTTAEYNLRKNCNLDVSLFERMVSNKIHCETLDVQHRMRPEIVRLIVAAIYPKLESHTSVYSYPPVRGINKNLFFITHTEPEEAVDDTGSRKNVHEAKFLIKLARHFILQDYEPEDITILAAYSGQMFCLWKEQKKIPLLKGVRITGVDNFQGEENKLILLSLVRSNEEANIGFLKIDNRVNVALSRAKEGLFIIGNMNILEKSDNAWPKIKQVLEENDQIGTELILQCQVHRDELTAVRTGDDFQKVTEGGCTKLCESQLNCGHICRSLCHITDREHNKYKCKEPCAKGLCEIGHPCPLKCYDECKPCEVLLPVVLKCGHLHNLPCHMNDTSKYLCPTIVETELECGHVVEKPCNRDQKKFPCSHACEMRRPCGHACERKCHIHNDPDHLKARCFKPCTRTSNGCTQTNDPHKCLKVCFEECMECVVKVKKAREPCGHFWTVPCHQTVNDMKCTKRCKKTLPCGHPCRLECWETCGKCAVKTDKIIDTCGHKVKAKCSQVVDRFMCHGICPRPLPCGHPCNKKCKELCETSCAVLIDSPHQGACGHTFKVPCSIVNKDIDPTSNEFLKYCREPCKVMLQCSHPCAGTCGECAQGRIHTTCKEKCGVPLICGHECDIPCRETCQPCNKKCYYRCDHTLCGKKCGEPCTECKEPCTRRCKHAQCKKLCSEPCNVAPCTEPCPKFLRCGHRCIGFCGDPCPPVCRVCHADHETFILFFGAEDEPDSRFVYLQECKHTIEANAMDTWMEQKTEQDEHLRSQEINVKRCPKCKTIIMTQRYSEYIKQVFKDIIAVKKKIFLDDKENTEQRIEMQTQVTALRHENLELYTESQNFKAILVTLQSALVEVTKQGKRNPINNIALENCRNKIDLLKNLAKMVKKGNLQTHLNIFKKCVQHFDFLLQYMIEENQFSKQKHSDLNLESKRFERIVHLFIAEKNNNFGVAVSKAAVKQIYDNLKASIYSTKKYSTEVDIEIRENLKMLCHEIDRSIVLQEHELQMVISAMQMGVGHWYKCPNGHLYVITECGGAVMTSRCNECGATIGGTQHQHLPTNQRLNIGDPNRSRVSKNLQILLKELLSDLKETHNGKRNPLNKITLQSCTAKIKLTKSLINIFNNGELQNNEKFYNQSLKQFDFILSHIVLTESRISEQKINDLELEVSRFEKFVHLFTIEKSSSFGVAFARAETKSLYSSIYNQLKSIVKYSKEADNELKRLLEELRLIVDKTISITEEEKKMIVKAVGLSKGRWFKCPKGHYYAIGACGGAMEIGKCNECGSQIGGQNHTLLETNQFAGEMDGAAHPAWSNAANMANYDFD